MKPEFCVMFCRSDALVPHVRDARRQTTVSSFEGVGIMNRRSAVLIVAACSLLAMLLSSSAVQAAAVWTGTAGDGLWSNDGNWSTPYASQDITIDVNGAVVTLNTTSANGTVIMSGTAANTTTLNIVAGANLHTYGYCTFGDSGTATVNQTGGTVQSETLWWNANWGDGTGTYNISGGVFTATSSGTHLGLPTSGLAAAMRGHGYINISDTASVQVVGLYTNYPFQSLGGTGVITQTGGTVTVSGVLGITHSGSDHGTYSLQGGTLTAATMNMGSGTAAFDFTGGTLHAGTVNFDLTNAGGLLAPGSSGIGTTDIKGNYVQTATGNTEVEIGSDSLFDLITVSGAGKSASLDGTLTLSLLNSYIPTLGQTFDVLTAETITLGQTFTLDSLLASLPSNEKWGYHVTGVAGSGQTLQLEVQSIPEPSAIVLTAIGLLGLLAYAWRKRE